MSDGVDHHLFDVAADLPIWNESLHQVDLSVGSQHIGVVDQYLGDDRGSLLPDVDWVK
jgi:hypothetical protein